VKDKPYVVSNRVFVLGLDELYRNAMKRHERKELLKCARRVATVLQVAPADVPIEGYYVEDELLTEYFRLVRGLQALKKDRLPAVASLPEFKRLLNVTSAPLYGRPQQTDKLLPAGLDPLSQAMKDSRPHWSVQRLTEATQAIALKSDDISLVGLAARIKDAVVLAATRESVVLYADKVLGAMIGEEPQYVWEVDADIVAHARRFIDAFNVLFGEELPPPEPAHAQTYWHAYHSNYIYGRCVNLGFDNTVRPIRHYHWGIYYEETITALAVQEFWHPEIWTTERYRSALRSSKGRPNL
jgi:hypothetical protein